MKLNIPTSITMPLFVMVGVLWTASPRDVFAVTACEAIQANGGAVPNVKCIRKRDLSRDVVRNVNMGDDSVDSSNVVNNSLTGADVLDNSISSADITNNSVNGLDVQDGTLTGADVANSSLTGADVLNNSINSFDITDNSISSADIADETLTTADVQNNSLYDADLADEAGVEFVGGSGSIQLTGTDVTVEAISVTAPTSGYIIANASGYFTLDEGSTTSLDWARCSLGTSTSIDLNAVTVARERNTSQEMGEVPMSLTRVFVVIVPGTLTIRLVCDEQIGDVSINSTHLNGIFVPTRY